MPEQNEYIMIGEAIILSEKRPRRDFFLTIVQRYSTFLGLLVLIILILSLVISFISHQDVNLLNQIFEAGWTVFWVGIYSLYYWLSRHPERSPTFLAQLMEPEQQVRRTYLRILGISIYLAGLYLISQYWLSDPKMDTLWLLFLVPLFISSQFGQTRSTIEVTIGSAIALTSLRWFGNWRWGTASALESVLDSASKIFWLILLTMMVQVLVKLFSYQSANLRLVQTVQEEIRKLREVEDDTKLLSIIAGIIHTNFQYKYVNILKKQPSGSATIEATSSTDPSHLGVTMELGKGITGYVMETGLHWYENDVFTGAEQRQGKSKYIHDNAFPDTVAELAVPIKVAGETNRVLDIQNDKPNVFLRPDVEVVQIIANLIGKTLQETRTAKEREEAIRSLEHLSKITEQIARRLFSPDNLQSILDEIARVARDELNVDLVSLYVHDPTTKQIYVGAVVGEPKEPKVFSEQTLRYTIPLVQKLVTGTENSFFHSNIHDGEIEPPFNEVETETSHGYESFPKRENIMSRVTVILRSGEHAYGVMFLNYTRVTGWTNEEKKLIHTFADLSTIAVSKGLKRKPRARLVQKPRDLTEREAEILRLLLKGNFIKQISTRLDISPPMVKKHIRVIGQIIAKITGEGEITGKGSYHAIAERAIELGLFRVDSPNNLDEI